jgi:hypothetical protein
LEKNLCVNEEKKHLVGLDPCVMERTEGPSPLPQDCLEIPFFSAENHLFSLFLLNEIVARSSGVNFTKVFLCQAKSCQRMDLVKKFII